MEKLYSGAATLGMLEAKASLVWNSFLGGVMILVAIVIFYFYNKKSKVPSEIKEDKPQGPNWLAFGLIVFGAIVIGSSLYKYYMVSHSQAYAAMSGAQAVTGVVNSELNNLAKINIPSLDMSMSGGYFYTETEL